MDSKHFVKKVSFEDSKARGFTLIELMVVVATLGILAATAISSFGAYFSRTRATEAVQGVSKMSQGETEYYLKNGSFVEAGPTTIPGNAKQSVAFTGNWLSINFGYSDPIFYGYQAVVGSGNVDCEALGDLDGDGDTSIYRRTVTATTLGSPPITSGLYVFDELE